MNKESLEKISKLLRYDILTSTTAAQSGHATSSLSAVELMATLFFGGFYHYDLGRPDNIYNDRVIFSKGHAAPLLYALYHAAGALKYEELLTLRHLTSHLEGHPTLRFPYTEVATGSLGQGLSMVVGMALGMRLTFEKIEGRKSKIDIENRRLRVEKNRPSIFNRLSSLPYIFVLLGDSELAEGQNWEAAQIASYYKLNNIVAIVDVNRLGQRGETMLEWDLQTYEKRFKAFGWNTIVVKDGHDIKQVFRAFSSITNSQSFDSAQDKSVNSLIRKPTVIIAKTIKGKGVKMWENKNGFHSKQISVKELPKVLKGLGKVDLKMRGIISKPNVQIPISNFQTNFNTQFPNTEKNKIGSILSKLEKKLHTIPYLNGDLIPTKLAFGEALRDLGGTHKEVVVLDAEVSNSTHTDLFKKAYPDRFFEMFIAEQNMASTAVGLNKQGFVPYVSTFAAFVSRAVDQIRMAQYSKTHMVVAGSYAGVMTGMDGASGMGLEDIAIMRSMSKSTVVYPSDAVSTYKLTQSLVHHKDISYIRLTREKTPVLYDEKEEFPIGGLKIHYPLSRHSGESRNPEIHGSRVGARDDKKIKAVIIAAGITVHVALKAQKILAKKGISVTVVDLYSVKPIDAERLKKLVKNVPHVIVAEDHYEFGGMGEAVLSALHLKVDDRKSKIDVEVRISKVDKNQSSNFHLQNSTLHLLPSTFQFTHLCVRKLPRSGTPQELLHFEHLDEMSMVEAVMK